MSAGGPKTVATTAATLPAVTEQAQNQTLEGRRKLKIKFTRRYYLLANLRTSRPRVLLL